LVLPITLSFSLPKVHLLKQLGGTSYSIWSGFILISELSLNGIFGFLVMGASCRIISSRATRDLVSEIYIVRLAAEPNKRADG
jgi:hypothetical protein